MEIIVQSIFMIFCLWAIYFLGKLFQQAEQEENSSLAFFFAYCMTVPVLYFVLFFIKIFTLLF